MEKIQSDFAVIMDEFREISFSVLTRWTFWNGACIHPDFRITMADL